MSGGLLRGFAVSQVNVTEKDLARRARRRAAGRENWVAINLVRINCQRAISYRWRLNFSEAALEESAFAFVGDEGQRPRIIFGRLGVQAEATQQIRARGV